MKAIRIHGYGDARVLKYEDAPVPVIGENEVLIRVIAASVNPVDWKIREGYLQKMITYPMPLILGWDVSGIVEAVGAKANQFKVGDAVYSRPDIKRNGTYAEYIAVKETEISPKPQTISHMEAASIPLVGITAWEALFTKAKLKAGEKVLIHAGAGGVGSLALQLAKAHGAHVITTASAKNTALLESLGADEVIDYRSQNFAASLKDVDVVFDTQGGQVQDASWAVLKKGGILVSISAPPSAEKADAMGARGEFLFIEPNAKVLASLAEYIDTGKIRPIVGAEYALKDMAKAHALSQAGHTVGKIVIHIGMP
jgi:NADPH:quinone reductase-like Zn-dependent oxidoreductase